MIHLFAYKEVVSLLSDNPPDLYIEIHSYYSKNIYKYSKE